MLRWQHWMSRQGLWGTVDKTLGVMHVKQPNYHTSHYLLIFIAVVFFMIYLISASHFSVKWSFCASLLTQIFSRAYLHGQDIHYFILICFVKIHISYTYEWRPCDFLICITLNIVMASHICHFLYLKKREKSYFLMDWNVHYILLLSVITLL